MSSVGQITHSSYVQILTDEWFCTIELIGPLLNNTLAKRKGQKDNGPLNTAHKTKQTPLKTGDGIRRSDIANTKT
jgi:hypothetical protein